MEKRIDLHLHTTASDGTETPSRTAELAREAGMAAIAITDHDTVSGVAEAMARGAELGVEVVPGVEFSADYQGGEAHILGLFIDPDAPALGEAMDWAAAERAARNERIVAALAADGFPISLEELQAEFPHSVLGRPHMAEHLVRRGCTASIRDAFHRYLDEDAPYYRPRVRMSLSQAVSHIRSAGGIAIAAHPLQYGYKEAELLAYLDACRAAGCAGLEAYYSEHVPEAQAYLLELAARAGMLVSGGSDWHGARKPHIAMGSGIAGSLAVPYSVLEALKAALDR